MTTSPNKVSVSLSSNYLQVNKKFLVAQQLNDAELANLNEENSDALTPSSCIALSLSVTTLLFVHPRHFVTKLLRITQIAKYQSLTLG